MKPGLLEVVLALQVFFVLARSQDLSAQAAIGIPATVTAGASPVDWELRAGTGDMIWLFDTGDDCWSAPVLADGTVFFGNRLSQRVALDTRSGELHGTFEVEDGTSTDRAFGEKTLYIVSLTGTVYAFH